MFIPEFTFEHNFTIGVPNLVLRLYFVCNYYCIHVFLFLNFQSGYLVQFQLTDGDTRLYEPVANHDLYITCSCVIYVFK